MTLVNVADKCAKAGIPADEAVRIVEAVSAFDLPDLRDRAADALIQAFKVANQEET